MGRYTLYLIVSRGSKANAPTETVDCASDALALAEACKFFTRFPNVDTIEVWEDNRQVVSLGGRVDETSWTGQPRAYAAESLFL